MIAGRYRLEREIGRGGAGVVHLAHDELLDRRVAIKRIGLLPGTTSDDVARAQREARLAAGINHPHVVSIFDLVKEQDCYWLVMEHVDGQTLAELVAAEGPLPERRAAAILAQAADALVQAGKAGIVHRDVKPSNIILTGDDQAKLGDFGIARSSSDTALTQTGMITGSPAYIAPEVASGRPATAASDVWSLGATLFHAVEGTPPYDVGDNVLGGLYRIVNDDPPRLSEDRATAGLLAATMVKDPQQRWPAERVRDELRRIAGGKTSDATAQGDEPGEATVAMSPPPPAPAVHEPTSTPAPTPAPAPTPVSGGSRGRMGWLAVALALVVVAALGAWLLWPGDEEPPDTAGNSTEPSTSAEPSLSDEPTSEPTSEPTEEPSETEEPTTEPSATSGAVGTRAAMRTFVTDYYSQVTSDPESTWEMLTPEFQAESGGFERYSGFWSTIASATPRNVRADPQSLVATYTIDFVTTSGRTTTEPGRLQLVEQGDGFLIAGEG